MTLALDSSLYTDVHPVLLGYARRAVRHDQLAEDLVQDTWFAGIRNLQSFDGRSAPRSWLVGILKHKIVDHFRRVSRERSSNASLESQEEPVADALIDAQRALRVTADALAALPELQRRAVELCDLRGLSRAHAASVLGVERGHLRVLLHRARAGLRQALEEAGLETPR